MELNSQYWENRYLINDAVWDAGSITTPIREYIDQLDNKAARILIPGCGNGYEFEYLIHKGFTNSFVLDYAESPLRNLKTRIPDYTEDRFIQSDFFVHDGQYDLILEQTFFCALDPELRARYVRKMHDLLSPKGKLTGVLFDFPLTEKGPPFGGSKKEYLDLFSEYFEIKKLEPAYNSIKPRLGSELFFIFTKK